MAQIEINEIRLACEARVVKWSINFIVGEIADVCMNTVGVFQVSQRDFLRFYFDSMRLTRFIEMSEWQTLYVFCSC